MALKSTSTTFKNTSTDQQGSFANPVLVHRIAVANVSKKYGIPEAILFGILDVEGGTDSRGRPVAPRDGAGPPSYGQFTFATGKSLGIQYGNSQSEVDGIARYLLRLGWKKGAAADSPTNKKAIASYNGGPANPQYDYAEKVLTAAKRYGGIPSAADHGIHIPNPLDPIKDGWNAITSIVQLILSPEAFGKLWARVFAFILKLFWKAFYDIVIAPPWHWTQRAVDYYFRNIMSARTGNFYYKNAGIITILFWSIGYGVLWGKAEQGAGKAQNARETMLGRSVRTGQNLFANRKVVKPKDVAKATSNKPEAVTSEIPISITRSIAVTRRRPVTVRQSREDGNNGDHTTQNATDFTT